MNLQELKQKNPAELINEAENLGIENPSTLRKQEILFAILKKLAEKNEQITATGVLEVLQDGFGFLRAGWVLHLLFCALLSCSFFGFRFSWGCFFKNRAKRPSQTTGTPPEH